MFAFSALEQTFTIGNIGNIGIFTAQTIQRIAFVLCFHDMNIIWFSIKTVQDGGRILIEGKGESK